ncbi:unnamed protein product [Owenia fusiformis]|uniref:Amino acid transporter n=1 Tax=Owenia fusiformis TaxID=6347 RepID=A0A8J1XTL4_OWEFU|nr:unnamed protein product [Owenia fusiformis]
MKSELKPLKPNVSEASFMTVDTTITMESESSTEFSTDSYTTSEKIRYHLKNNMLLVLTMLSIVIGFAAGFGIRWLNPTKDAIMWIGLPGEMFLRMLKMMILPLIISSVIAGTASMDPKSNGRISGIALAYVNVTNVIACIIGIGLTVSIKPGNSAGIASVQSTVSESLATEDIFADLIRNLFPDNIIEAALKQAQTKYIEADQPVLSPIEGNWSDAANATVEVFTKTVGKVDSTNILGIVICCMLYGIATSTIGEAGYPFLAFFRSASDITLKILRWLLWYSPVGICSLMAATIAGIGNLEATFLRLGLFILTVTVGIVIHQAVVIPLIHFIATRKNPYPFYVNISRAWFTGFAATSTAVTIPEMLRACDEKKVDERVSKFVIPFCVTLNADGSALYITSAAIFIGQLSGVDMNVGKILIIGILTAVACLALPSVPSSSIVTLVIILTTLNIPTEDISLLFAVEWYLDRIRTTSNIVSHTFCARFTYHFCREELQRVDAEKEAEREILRERKKNLQLHKSVTFETLVEDPEYESEI